MIELTGAYSERYFVNPAQIVSIVEVDKNFCSPGSEFSHVVEVHFTDGRSVFLGGTAADIAEKINAVTTVVII